VSAINDDSGSAVDDEVHVTLVRSFLDLVPFQLGGTELLDIPCSERVRLKAVDKLREQVGTLTAQNAELAAQINTLMRSQIRLFAEAERAGREDMEVTDLSGASVIEQNIALSKRVKDLFDLPLIRPPLRPTVTAISSALGNPKWTLSGSINTNQDVTITLNYERTLAGPPHALDMYFCFRAILWDVPGDTPVRDNPTDAQYYEKFDGPFEEGQTGLDNNECEKVSHTAANAPGTDPNSITKGLYRWQGAANIIRRLKGFHDKLYPGKSWNGVYYLQIFEPMKSEQSDKLLYRLHARAIIDVTREEASSASALPCRYFETSPAKSGDLDKLASGELRLEEEEICAQDM
jgi:hypothetical protein